MTPTSANAEQSQERGLTLFELLIVLALLGLMGLMAVSSVRASSPKLSVKTTAEQLLADLKRARIETESTGAPIDIVIEKEGYAIETLNVARTLPHGVNLSVANSTQSRLTIGPGYWLSGYEIEISKGDASAKLSIAPVTRRMSLQ
ncbi:MAG: hypothetical protein DHS20C05_16680 [Hyphococcus sp.]|nr:MAG: hypothetical protein DHS20C05_16680 [Marinicaulis sp.]